VGSLPKHAEPQTTFSFTFQLQESKGIQKDAFFGKTGTFFLTQSIYFFILLSENTLA